MKKSFTLHQMTTRRSKFSTLFAAIIVLLITATSNTASAAVGDNFTEGIFKYKITSEDPKTVELAGYNGDKPSGNLEIPATVTNNNITYSVTSIGEYAFSNCKSLTSVTIPKGVTSIGGKAFLNCHELTAVTIPDGVTYIGKGAFNYCENLISVNIPNGVTKILDETFYQCQSLTSITIPQGVTSIGGYAFMYCDKLSSVTIPESVTYIGTYAFCQCKSLSYLFVPSSVTKIEKDAFTTVKMITYDGKAEGSPFGAKANGGYIEGDFVYSDDTKKELLVYIGNGSNVTIPSGVTTIGKYAFSYCSTITSLTIPQSVTTIKEYAFLDCKQLIDVTIPATITTIETGAFYDVKNINYSGNLSGCPWGALVVNGIVDGDFIFEDKQKTQLGAYIGKGGHVTIPDGVTLIGDRLFDECKEVTSVTIPESVKTIEALAFAHTNLTAITIPQNVTRIETDAFYCCYSLNDAYFYPNPENLTWDKSNFNFKVKSWGTNCHVLAEYKQKYSNKFQESHYYIKYIADLVIPSDNEITISEIDDAKYTGKAVEPTITVKYNNSILTKGEDYTLVFTNNVDLGTASVTIYGTRYKFTKETSFTIVKGIPEYTIPTISEQKCNANPSDIILPNGFKFENTETNLSIGENNITLSYNPDETHYETVTGIEVTITLSHSYSKPTYTWSDDGKTCTATVACQNDESHDITETASISSEVTTPATTEAKGKTTYTAKFQNSIFTTQTKEVEDIDKLEVNPTNPTDPANPSTPIATITDNTPVKVWSYNSTIYIESAPDAKYTIIDLNGRTIATSTTKSSKEQININHSGIYLVIIDNQSFKVSL